MEVFAESVWLFLKFFPISGGSWGRKAAATADVQSRWGTVAFVIAACHLQRVLRILVKTWGEEGVGVGGGGVSQ